MTEEQTSTPACPQCGALMVKRTARAGSNAGKQFWGCSRYPECRTTVDINSGNHSASSDTNLATAEGLPVEWVEGAERRDFDYEYLTIGSLPGVVRGHLDTSDQTLRRLLSQTLILRAKQRTYAESTPHAQLTAGLLAKLLQRGHIPLPTLGIERAALEANGLLDAAEDLQAVDGGMEVGWELPHNQIGRETLDQTIATFTVRDPFALGDEYHDSREDALIDSPNELWFLKDWIPANLGAQAAHWVTPQASLDTLLEANGGVRSGYRRVDFLVAHPNGKTFVVEIDGAEHEDSIEVDANRDEELQRVGIDVIRISNHEIVAGSGPGLDQVRERWSRAVDKDNTASQESLLAELISDCAFASKVQVTIARALAAGLLAGNEWVINISGGNEVSIAAVVDTLKLLSGYDTLYGGSSAPERCTVMLSDSATTTWQFVDDAWTRVDDVEAHGSTISILIERAVSPFHVLPSATDYDFIIRPAYLPVDFALPRSGYPSRQTAQDLPLPMAERALTTFLRETFRKWRFRPQQADAVYRSLRQRDLLVLLPTGFGKSIIYQLSGLLMPGITLVVDPLVALIEDQVEGLNAHGIERVTGISGRSGDRRARELLTKQISQGAYFFVLVAPERLQSPEFRQELNLVRDTSLINLAVIDEAHCVSEWGHDFRPSYLKLADNLRRLGRDSRDGMPPILGLTGTASRAVLKDILTDIGMGQADSASLIRPDSFDRHELTFSIRRVESIRDAENALKSTVRSLPSIVYPSRQMTADSFFRPQGRGTNSGIIFTRAKTGQTGVERVAYIVRNELGARPGTYAGDPNAQQIADAKSFKSNELSILVSTKAFGMGIDKPNIRWILHYGMPGSLESFYQEAGRAGRDQRGASCIITYTEYDKARSDSLLDLNSSLEELRARFESIGEQKGMRDDVTTALYFHNESFPEQDVAIDQAKRILYEYIPNIEDRQRKEIPWANSPSDFSERSRQEHAIVRLMRVGIIEDYVVDFSKRCFVVDTARFSLEGSKKLLLDYIRLAQPQLTLAFSQRLDDVAQTTPLDNALELVSLLIDFTYEVVERARRRAIWEAISLVRVATDDSDFRRRLLDYLQGGIALERIENLLTAQTVAMDQWWSLLDEIQTPLDAGELRGICARALESYPEHPGLLFIRGAAEAMCSDYDWRASTDNLTAAVRQGQRLLVPEQSTIDMVNHLYDMADSGRAPAIGPPLTYALTIGLADGSGSPRERSPFAATAKERGARLDDCASILATYESATASRVAIEAIDRTVSDFEPQVVRDLLEVTEHDNGR